MKISHVIFLAGILVLAAEIIIFQANLKGYSDTVDDSLVNEESVGKITLLYILIGIIFFVFGGIVNFIEKKSEQKSLQKKQNDTH